MDPAITATVIGVLLTVAFGALATAFAWLRSDTNVRFDKVDVRFDKVDARFDKMDDKVDARFDKVDARFERLEAKVDGLILGLTRRGLLAEPDNSETND